MIAISECKGGTRRQDQLHAQPCIGRKVQVFSSIVGHGAEKIKKAHTSGNEGLDTFGWAVIEPETDGARPESEGLKPILPDFSLGRVSVGRRNRMRGNGKDRGGKEVGRVSEDRRGRRRRV